MSTVARKTTLNGRFSSYYEFATDSVVVLAESVLGGLHHEYSRAPSVA